MIASNRLLIACACLLLADVQTVHARQKAAVEVPQNSILTDMAFVPTGVDTVLVVRDARLFRQAPVGQAAQTIADDLLSLPRTRKAWAELAAMLDLQQDVAFDEILGQRIVFVERDAIDDEHPAQWTIVCDVRPNIADALRTKLKAAPRRILEGVPLLAIEEGRFDMAVVGKAETSRVVLAPARSNKLMEEIARRLEGGPGDVFIRTDPARRLDALGAGGGDPVRAVFYRRFEDAGGDGIDWIGGVVRLDPFALRSEFVLRTNELDHEVPPTSIELFDALRQDSLLTIVETIDPHALEDNAPGKLFLDRIQFQVNSMLARTGATRYAVSLRGVGAGGLSAAIGVQTPSAADAAPAIDDVMNELLLMLATQAGLGAWDFDFQGLQPAAERVADLGGRFRLLGGAPLTVRWESHDDQWWVASLPGPAGQHMTEAIDAQANVVMRRWLVVGSARPAQLLEALAVSMPGWGNEVPSPLKGFSQIEEVTWTAWQQSENEVLGRFEIEVARDR
jgi:hypothetical protein